MISARILQGPRGAMFLVFVGPHSWAWRIGPGSPLHPLGIASTAPPVRLPEPAQKAA